MPVEQRVVTRQKIGARPVIAEKAAPSEPEKPAKEGRRRGVVVVVVAAVVVLAALGVVAYLLLGRGADGAEPVEPPREPGEVLQVEAISINLADGHYLRLGLGLQLTADAGKHGTPDPSKALDLAIALYSGRPMAEVTDAATRESLKAELARQLDEAYEGEVMDVYLTTYVTQ